MSRANAKRRRQQERKATQQLNLVRDIDLLEPINISEAAFTRRMAKKQQQAASSGPQNLSMAWDDTSLGVGSTQTRDGLLDEKERKDTYYKVFLGNQWVSGCVNVISKRITSGGWECVEVEQGKGDPANKEKIQNLLRFENIEEDFLQFLRSIATDILVFGEAYCELVWQNGEVIGLYMIDAVSMTTHFDKHGTVIKYTQSLERSTQTVDFEPDQIVRWWLPDPRAKKKALSPIEHLKDPVYLEQSMITWVEKFFKQGARPNFSVELGPDTGVEDAQRYVKFFKENYTGIQNAHVPPVMYGGGKIQECGNGTIDIDFDKGQDKQRDRVLSVYGVPPAEINIIDSGNIGGGTGESQSKAFMYNTVIPIEQLILEKFNYRVIQKGLGIDDWRVATIQADYRSDVDVVTIQDKQVRNGTKTINEVRRSIGSPEVVGGDEAVIIAGKDITPVSRFKDVAAEQAQSAQIAIKMQQAQLDKAKQPPAPAPGMMPPGQQPPDAQQQQDDGQQQPSDNNQNGADNTQQPNAKQQQNDNQNDNAKEALIQYYLAREQKQWQQERLQESSHTGVMVAFFLKPSEAQQLVLPGGESIDDLHLTLAYLCDSGELSDHEALKMAVASYAQNAPVLKGVVSGIGRFLAVPDGELTPVYASIDSPNLSEFRENLVRALRSADFPPSMQHGYTPHCTLAYVPKSAPMPIKDIATIPLNFDTLWLAIGDDRYAFPLNRSNNNAQQQSKETSQEASLQDLAQSKESRKDHARDARSEHFNEAYREDANRPQGRQWRAITTEQDALEKQASVLITKFLKSGKISDKSFTVSQDTQDKLAQDLAQILRQAHGLGAQHGNAMVGRQNEAVSIKSIGTNVAYFLKRAKDIVSGLVTRISNVVSDVVSKGGDASDAKEVVGHMMDYVPDQTSVTAVHDEVEHGVDDVFDDEHVEFIEWICEPDACGVCLDNQSAGPVKRTEVFPSGHKRPIAHFNCRCNVVPSEG